MIRQRMRRAENEEGVVLIEFAFVFALFVFILYSLIAFGSALGLKQSLTHAATEGARAAVGVADDPSTTNDERVDKVVAQVQDSLDWIGSRYSDDDVEAVPGDCTDGVPSSGTCMFVTITYPYEDKPIVPSAPGLGVLLPETMKTEAVVKIN